MPPRPARSARFRSRSPTVAIGAVLTALGTATAARADIPPAPPGPFGSASGVDSIVLVLLGASGAAFLAAAAGRRLRAPAPGKPRQGCGALVVTGFVLLGLCTLLALPSFLPFRVKPRRYESKSNLGAIRSTEVAYFAEWNYWIGGQPLTPVADRRGNGERARWDPDTRFSILGFAPEGKVACSYALEGPPYSSEGFSARAECDDDNDGQVAIYHITSTSNEIVNSGAPF